MKKKKKKSFFIVLPSPPQWRPRLLVISSILQINGQPTAVPFLYSLFYFCLIVCDFKTAYERYKVWWAAALQRRRLAGYGDLPGVFRTRRSFLRAVTYISIFIQVLLNLSLHIVFSALLSISVCQY